MLAGPAHARDGLSAWGAAVGPQVTIRPRWHGRAAERRTGILGALAALVSTHASCDENRAFYLLIILKPSLTMRAPRVAAAPLSTPLVMVSLCSVPNFLAEATIGSAAAWNPSSKAPEPLAAS